MGMSVFNRPQAGACPVCGAPMYYRQAPILLEHDFEQYDVWASVRYCEDCGIEIMVPGEAKIARHSARYTVEKDIRAKEAAARNAAQAKPRKEHPFLPKEEAANAQTKNTPARQAAEEKKEQTVQKTAPQNDQVPKPETKASVPQTPMKKAESANGKSQTPPKDPTGHQEAIKKQPYSQGGPQGRKNSETQKKQPEQIGQKDPGKQNQPRQNRGGQNLGGISQALKDRLPIGKTSPGELPITRGRFGMSDLNLTSSAAQNISNLLDMTETREMIQENGLEAASSLTAQNVDAYIFSEELSTEPQIDRRDKRKNRGQDGRKPERTDMPKTGERPSADTRKDRSAKEQPPVKNNVDGRPTNTQNPDARGMKSAGEKRPSEEQPKNAQTPGQGGRLERKEQGGQPQEIGKNPRNVGPQKTQPQAASRDVTGRPPQAGPMQKPTDNRDRNTTIVRDEAPDASQTLKQNGQPTGQPTTGEPKPQMTGAENSAPKPAQPSAPEQKSEPAKRTDRNPKPETQNAASQMTIPKKTEPEQKNTGSGTDGPVATEKQEQTKTAPEPSIQLQAAAKESASAEKKPEAADGKEKAANPPEPKRGTESPKAEELNPEDKTGKTEAEKTPDQEKPQGSENAADGTKENTEEASSQEAGRKLDPAGFRKTIAKHLPAWVVSRIPFLADAVSMPTDTPISVEKDFVKRYQTPHCKEIVGDLLYDTDTSEMFLRKESSYGFDRPCIRFNYRSQNGHFFCCSVRYDRHNKNGHVELRPMDTEMEVKPMLRRYPELYKRFFESDLKNA